MIEMHLEQASRIYGFNGDFSRQTTAIKLCLEVLMRCLKSTVSNNLFLRQAADLFSCYKLLILGKIWVLVIFDFFLTETEIKINHHNAFV